MTNDSLNMFKNELKKHLNQVEAKLQTEESGNKIAFLQGECAGYRSFWSALNAAGYTTDDIDYGLSINSLFDFDEKEKEWNIKTRNYNTLKPWENAACDVGRILEISREKLDQKVQEQKDWLFYNSEKSRDLYWIKGWYFIMQTFDEWCAMIHDAYKNAKKDHDSSFDFGKEEEE